MPRPVYENNRVSSRNRIAAVYYCKGVGITERFFSGTTYELFKKKSL